MQRIAYGTVTKSIEDPAQLFLLDLDDERFGDLDSEGTISLLEDVDQDVEIPWQQVVGLEDALAAVRSVLLDAGYDSVEDTVIEIRERMLAGKAGRL